MHFYKDDLELVRMDRFVKIHNDLRKDFPIFFYLYQRIKKESLNKQDITVLVRNQQKLKDLEHRVDLYSEFIRGQQLQKQQLEQEIERLKSKNP
jgi:hypothetical protein